MPKHTIEYEIAECRYKPDVALLEKYHGFSTEILRLALLILAAIGVLLGPNLVLLAKGTSKPWLLIAVVASGLSSAFALAHRYVSTEALAYEMSFLRGTTRALEFPTDEDLASRQVHEHIWLIRMLKLSTRCLFLAAAGLIGGAVAITIALYRALAA